MKRSDAKRRYKRLRHEFDVELDSCGESILNKWVEKARRLASDAFGPQDPLCTDIERCMNRSENFIDSDQLEYPIISKAWFKDVRSWLERLAISIDASDKLEEFKLHQAWWFAYFWPVLVGILFFFLNMYSADRQFDAEQALIDSRIKQENEIELASVMADYEFWVKSVPMGLADSIEAIREDFASRGLYRSGMVVMAEINFARRKRFNMDSARTSYFAKISALGGDTLKLNPPRKLPLKIFSNPLGADLRKLGVDTL